MKIVVENEKLDKTIEVDFNGSTVKDLLEKIDVNSQTVLVVRNDEVLTQDETLQDNDTVKLLSVISGG